MRNLFVCTFILLFAVSSSYCNSGEIKIIGVVTGYSDSTVVVLNNFATQTSVDTTYIINNKFSFTAPKGAPTEYGIFIINGEELEFLFLFLEDVNIYLTGKKGNFKYADIIGGKIQGQSSNLKKVLRTTNERFDNVNRDLLKAIKDEDLETVKFLEKQETNIIEERIVLMAKYIKGNPDYLISAFTLKGLIPGLPKSEIKSLYENLSPKIKESDYAKSVFNFLELSKEVKIGDIAEDFQLPDINGNIISLKDFRGKYVLLEFWKAGCASCRIENKNLLAEYILYKDKGFEIIGITSDKNKKNWISALKADSITWISLQETDTKNAGVRYSYNVRLIPSNFLIDPNGRIISMNLRGKELGEKLKEIL